MLVVPWYIWQFISYSPPTGQFVWESWCSTIINKPNVSYITELARNVMPRLPRMGGTSIFRYVDGRTERSYNWRFHSDYSLGTHIGGFSGFIGATPKENIKNSEYGSYDGNPDRGIGTPFFIGRFCVASVCFIIGTLFTCWAGSLGNKRILFRTLLISIGLVVALGGLFFYLFL